MSISFEQTVSRWSQRLQCVQCSASLSHVDEQHEASLSCAVCGTSYAVTDGVVHFSSADAFYETHGFTRAGRDFSDSLLGRFGAYFARGHFLHEITRHVPSGSAVIEIGCGGGSRYLARRYEMLGVDLSSHSARCARQTYGAAIQARVEQLPLVDGCADALVSSYVLEHLDMRQVVPSLREMARVLRPGGVMLHCFDLHGDSPFYRWARRQTWYQRQFIEARGHAGLRTLDTWVRHVGEAGLSVEGVRPFCKGWLQDLSIWSFLDDPQVTGLPRFLGRTANRLRSRFGGAADALVTMCDDVTRKLLSDRWAAKVILRARKPL